MTTGSRSIDIVRVGTGARAAVQDLVAIEEPMEVRVNGAPFAVIMRTPGADRELAAGFLLAEDVIHGSEELGTIEYCADVTAEGRDNTLNVTVIGEAIERLGTRLGERRQVMMTASCGLCGRRTIESLRSRVPFANGQWTVGADIIRGLPAKLRRAQDVFDSTGGLHAAGLFTATGKLLCLREDVGRHNAVDKVLGYGYLGGTLPFDRHVLLVSGRASFEILQKALAARVPVVAAVSAPSSLAVEFAADSGQTLVGFLREGRMNVYSEPGRIRFSELAVGCG